MNKKTIIYSIKSALPVMTGYRFMAKNPHACVWDESHISLDIYLEKNI